METKKIENATLRELVTREQFINWFDGLEIETRLQLAREYATEYGCDGDVPYDFDDEFFDMAFGGRPMEAARAAHFGDINWSDEYIRFNVYGNLESMSVYDVEDWCEYTAGELYDCDEAPQVLDWCGFGIDDIAAEIAEEATVEA